MYNRAIISPLPIVQNYNFLFSTFSLLYTLRVYNLFENILRFVLFRAREKFSKREEKDNKW